MNGYHQKCFHQINRKSLLFLFAPAACVIQRLHSWGFCVLQNWGSLSSLLYADGLHLASGTLNLIYKVKTLQF